MKKKPGMTATEHDASPPKNEPPLPPPARFPIVGIGASAGGLEALEQFLRNVAENCGVAFVVVQHLDPTHKGIMPELLQRITSMPVFQVKDRMRVKPGCVYVIPPNKDMSVLHGLLYLFEPAAPRGLRLPINFFLRSLAEDRREAAIGVILSGMGSDGTEGLQAIKARGGIALVQEPGSAKFDSMPISAINAGLADIVAPAEDLPVKLAEFLHHTLVISRNLPEVDQNDHSALDKIIILLRTSTGNDFSLYKKNTVYRRVERRMGVHQISRISTYVRFLQDNPQEVELLFKELLIGVTSFFRDPEVWEQIRDQAVPLLLAGYPAGGRLRAWSAGCSTGEEAYSLAIIFKEALEQIRPAGHFTLQIFATDLDQDAIDFARRAVYPAKIAQEVGPGRLQRFFVKDGTSYRVCKEIRETVTFAMQNIIMDAPFTKLDILICRNLLIYLTPELQQKLMPLFHYSLNPGAVLCLGSAESASTFTDLFAPLHIKSRLFRTRETLLQIPALAFPSGVTPLHSGISTELPMIKATINIQSLADQLLLQHFSPPAVLTNNRGDIVYISGHTGRYLEPAAGKANWNIFAMAREGLRFEVGNAFQKALRQKGAVVSKTVKIEAASAAPLVSIRVEAIEAPEALRGMVMIIFSDVPPPLKTKRAGRAAVPPDGTTTVTDLQQTLQQVREDLQTTREEMHSSQEELTSTNEELQSTNEELQSTNEELTTSREEMQSLNEELQTVNAEQQAKMDEFARVNDDMRNLLNSTEIVTIFLDNNLHIRRFTTGADKLFKLRAGDIGRPLSDIVTDLLYPGMTGECNEVLRTLAFSERQVVATDGSWFSVRIMPYRTLENVIAGVVLTFANISAAKMLEAGLRAEIERLKAAAVPPALTKH